MRRGHVRIALVGRRTGAVRAGQCLQRTLSEVLVSPGRGQERRLESFSLSVSGRSRRESHRPTRPVTKMRGFSYRFRIPRKRIPDRRLGRNRASSAYAVAAQDVVTDLSMATAEGVSKLAKFLIQGSYTAEGSKGLIKEGGTGRKAAVRKALEGLGRNWIPSTTAGQSGCFPRWLERL
jgi:hypothetical protein